jgi:DNA-binding GntR family transcriptional regulator
MDTDDVAAADAVPARGVGRPKGTGSQRIYEAIRQRILRLDLPPGMNVDEIAIGQEFGVSRTPVREALIRLAGDGLVQILPNRGARVSPLDLTETPEMLEALDLCLRVTTRWAALRRTAEDVEAMRTHCKAWIKAARRKDVFGMSEANNHLRNRHLVAMYRALQPGFLRLSLTLLSVAITHERDHDAYYRRLDDEHRNITDLIARGDVEAADAATRQHIGLMRERTMKYMQNNLAASMPYDRLT